MVMALTEEQKKRKEVLGISAPKPAAAPADAPVSAAEEVGGFWPGDAAVKINPAARPAPAAAGGVARRPVPEMAVSHGRPVSPPSAAPAPAAPPAPAAATKPSIAGLSFNAENPTYKGPKLESQAKGYLDARMPNIGDTRVALPGGGYGSAADLIGPEARPSIPADYDKSNPAQVQLRTGAATQVAPATLADVQAHWNPQQGAGRGGAPNIFMDMIPESIRGAVSARFGGAGGFGTDHPEVMSYDPQREARMTADSRGIIGPNGRISRSMVRLREQEMQGADTRRGQDVQARGQDFGVFSEGMRQTGEERRSLRSDETSRRGQDMGFRAGQEGRAADLEREGMGNRTSLAVADRNLAGQVYSSDQRVATSAAKNLAEQAGLDASSINKLLEVSFDPVTGVFSPELFKANLPEIMNALNAQGSPAGGGHPDGKTGRDKQGNPVVKRNGRWVPLNQ